MPQNRLQQISTNKTVKEIYTYVCFALTMEQLSVNIRSRSYSFFVFFFYNTSQKTTNFVLALPCKVLGYDVPVLLFCLCSV